LTKNELNDIWEQALYILEKKLNKHSFDTWIKPIKPLRYFNNRCRVLKRRPKTVEVSRKNWQDGR
jgi:hypothetical protein